MRSGVHGYGFFGAALLAVLAAAMPARAGDGGGRLAIEVESGAIWQTRNDVRIPSTTGTGFSLRDVQGSGPFAFGRVSVDYRVAPKHEFRFLVAPLSLTASGSLAEPTVFADTLFAAGPGVDATYRFNSYRATYRYRFFDGERWKWKIGVTGKIRDARIELTRGGLSARDENIGFVPLLHLDGEYKWSDRWRLNVNVDGLAAPQGRAFDAAVLLKYDLSKNWTFSTGYRLLEGGADTSDVYTFGWFHYAAASIAFRF